MKSDLNKAATAATETLIRYSVQTTPVSPLRILEQMDNVIVISFSEVSDSTGISRSEFVSLLGKNRDAITSVHSENGKKTYVVAYNRLLPFTIIQRALAREMAHIVLNHDGSSAENEKEAECFSVHLLCPRPLIHAIQATGMKITVDLLSNLTGVFDQFALCMRHLPGTSVPSALNRFVRGQFMPFFANFFEYYQYMKPQDGSAVADFGTYMNGYEE